MAAWLCAALTPLTTSEVSMRGKSLFVERVIARPVLWQNRFSLLLHANQSASSISDGRQIVAAAADADGVRCVFFTTLGSVLDFRASWADLEHARGWWEFAVRWNFWILPDREHFDRLASFRPAPQAKILSDGPAGVTPTSEAAFLRFLDTAEACAADALIAASAASNVAHAPRITSVPQVGHRVQGNA
ncbi:hypothetical protein [Paraburkholderia megapolitana]|uniref:hypothetical protein n=1 Tax=Paraburkholderia megapolitana TaxID=420953 RepID=UPI0038BABB63